MLMKTASQSLTEQLFTRFAERIRTRLLAPGARLPSVRQCALQQGVSPSTVVAAYDQLLAQGLVEARKNRGFYVREIAPALENTSQGAIELVATVVRGGFQAQHVPVNATALIRGMFHRSSEQPQPGMGAFPPDWLETTFMATAVRKVTSNKVLQSFSLQYGEPAGDSGLRQALSQKLVAHNVQAAPSQIVTTVGATHALDIVSRTLLRAGDCVMVEEPGWAIEFARLAALGMRILPVPRCADGPDLDVMARYCELHAPKLFVSVSVFHNPTGYCLTPGSAHRVLQMANSHNFHIVEDDTYSHIAPDHATRLCALDGLQRIDQGQLRRHAERIRTRLDQARGRSVKLALAHGCRFATPPAGLFGWVDTGVDTDALSQRMLDEGYLLAPGALFHAERQPSTLMRINFATTQDAQFWEAFARLRAEQQTAP